MAMKKSDTARDGDTKRSHSDPAGEKEPYGARGTDTPTADSDAPKTGYRSAA